jgi:hypothetical protein
MATQKDGTGKSGGLKAFVLAAVGTCLLGLPVGFFLSDVIAPFKLEQSYLKKIKTAERAEEGQKAGNAETSEATESADATENVPQGPFEVVQLPPIITNIEDPAKVWVRLEGNLLFDPKGKVSSAVLTAKLAQHVLAYLKTLRLTDLQGAGAIHALSQDLDEIVKTLSDGQVQGVLISGLVLE